MPRLSIVIPFRNDDSRLEATLVSILENQPVDSEIILAHDGSYTDPYQIGDEAIFVEDANCSVTGLLNEAVHAANAELVTVLLDGSVVTPGWCDEALEMLESDQDLSSVALGIDCAAGRTAGITPLARCSGRTLMRGEVDAALGKVQYAGPALAGGLYRRQTLTALGGWNERLSVQVADIELAWMMQSLDLVCESASGCPLQRAQNESRVAAGSDLQSIAELCVAYGITGSGAIAAATGWISAMLACGPARAGAWSSGLRGGRITRTAISRLQNAERELAELQSTSEVLVFPQPQPIARAA